MDRAVSKINIRKAFRQNAKTLCERLHELAEFEDLTVREIDKISGKEKTLTDLKQQLKDLDAFIEPFIAEDDIVSEINEIVRIQMDIDTALAASRRNLDRQTRTNAPLVPGNANSTRSPSQMVDLNDQGAVGGVDPDQILVTLAGGVVPDPPPPATPSGTKVRPVTSASSTVGLPTPTTASSAVPMGTMTTVVTTGTPSPFFKLPSLKIVPFDGEFTRWTSFWNQFQNAVDKYPTISAADKLQFLVSFLRGPPLDMVRDYQFTDDNYALATTQLFERYGAEQNLRNQHLDALFGLEPVVSMEEHEALRDIEREISLHVNALSHLNVNLEMFLDRVTKLFPRDLVRPWRHDARRKHSISDLLQFVRKELNELENWASSQSTSGTNSKTISTTSMLAATTARKKGGVSAGASKQERRLPKTQRVGSSAPMQAPIHQEPQKRPAAIRPPEVGQPFQQGARRPAYCLFCDVHTHWGRECMVNIPLQTKRNFLTERGKCHNCLKPGHLTSECTFPFRSCTRCGGRHFVVMCPTHPYAGEVSKDVGEPVSALSTLQIDDEEETSEEDDSDDSVAVNVVSSKGKKNTVLMQTVEVVLQGKAGRMAVLGLLDSGSQKSFLKQELITRLKLKQVGHESLKIEGFAGVGTEHQFPVAKIKLHSLCSVRSSVRITVLGIPTLTNYRAQTMSSELSEVVGRVSEFGFQLADSRKETSREIQLIIGADYLNSIVSGSSIRVTSSLTAYETLFGWTLQGRLPLRSNFRKSAPKMNRVACHLSTIKPCETLESTVKRMWELESIGIKDEGTNTLTETDEKLFFEKIRFEDGAYTVSLPWDEKKRGKLAHNHDNALQRFKTTVRRLLKDPALFQQYSTAIEAYEAEGHAEPVNESNDKPGNVRYYLPHHPVIDETRSTKCRIVFDASSHGDQELSLNDCLYNGVNLNLDIVKILLGFRAGEFGLTADVRKAFLQIRIDERDRDVLRYFWVNKDLPPEQFLRAPRVLRMTRATFGVVSSPFILNSTIKKHCEMTVKERPAYGPSVKTLLNSLYMDDIVLSERQETQVQRKAEEITGILGKAGFKLHKIVKTGDIVQPNQSPSVLGVNWNSECDCLSLKLPDFSNLQIDCLTKRKAVSLMASVFDPLGLINPVVMQARLMVRELWSLELDWDEGLPEEERSKWEAWVNRVDELKSLKFPRHLAVNSSVGAVMSGQFALHAFADASPQAFGAVVYLQYVDVTGYSKTSLLLSRFRVAPLDQTVPRLELTAATMASRLITYLSNNFFQPREVTCWSDSTITLAWIRNPKHKPETFVENRVREIRRKTSISEWKHCPGLENPADVSTRKKLKNPLLNNNLWWHGPAWLSDVDSPQPDQEEVLQMEIENYSSVSALHIAMAQPDARIGHIINLNNFSSFSRLIGLTVTVLKAVHRFKQIVRAEKEVTLTETEYFEQAEILWIKDTQEQYFSDELRYLRQQGNLPSSINSSLYQLRPILDIDGVLRVHSRLSLASLTYDEKYPIILPKMALWTFMLIQWIHQDLKHAGTSTLVATIRQKYWIPSVRRCRMIIRRCLLCARLMAKPRVPPIGLPPQERVDFTFPFQCVGLDYAGPLFVRHSLPGPIVKAYILLFSCASSRAIHLEITSSLTTQHFELALRRFIARRGSPSVIYSDNAAQFKRASKDLAEYSTKLGLAAQAHDPLHQIEWRFIAERSPWWGGFWERMVRSVKDPLKKTLGTKTLTYEELETVVVEIEGIINSRPLSVTVDDDESPTVLTPAHLLIGKPLISLNHGNLQTRLDIDLVHNFRLRQKLLLSLTDRWRKEYLLQLRSFHCVKPCEFPTRYFPGQLVLLVDDKKVKHHWQIARIQSTTPGRDGIIRSCELRTLSGKPLRRSVNLLVPLELVNRPQAGPTVEIRVPTEQTNLNAGAEEKRREMQSASEPTHSCD